MGIFDRLSTLIRSNISDLISRGENPEKMLNQLIVDMRSQLAKAKQQVAASIADEKRLGAQVDQEKKSAEDWEKRAVLAVQGGRGDPGKQGLPRDNEPPPGGGEAPGTRGKHPGKTPKAKNPPRPPHPPPQGPKRQKKNPNARAQT